MILAPPLRIAWEKYPQLHPMRGDDCLVAETMAYANLNHEVVLVSHDSGPRHTAKYYGVRTFKVPDDIDS